MDDLPKVLIELEALYEERREEFLDAAFKISWIALDWCAAQLDSGHLDIAESELRNVDNSRGTMSHFLAQVKVHSKRRHLESEMRRLEGAIRLLKSQMKLS